MTTIISRLYADKATADSVVSQLLDAGHDSDTIAVVTAGQDPTAVGVSAANAAAYAPHLKGDAALVVVCAPFNPIGTAHSAIRIVNRTRSLDAGAPKPDHYVRHRPDTRRFLSVMTDHPRFFSQDMGESRGRERGPVSEAFGFRTVSDSPTKTSAVGKSRLIAPGPQATGSRVSTSASRDGRTISSMFGLPTISSRS